MNRIDLSIVITLLVMMPAVLLAQQIQFEGWLDDEHYLISKAANGGELFKVAAVGGEESPYTAAAEPQPESLLPSGMSVTRYNSTYSESGRHLILNEDNDLYLASLPDSSFRRLTGTPAPENNPTFSPDETKIAYTREHNLYVLNLETGLERQLTTDGSDLILNGYASWVYYEEILGRASQYKAFYWSPDSERIAYLRFDDEPVPTFPIYHHEGNDRVHGYLEMTRYPKAGDPLPGVQLGVIDLADGKTTWVDREEELVYTAWIFWTPDAESLLFQQMNRDQNHLKIFAADPATGERREVYQERQPTWVEFYEELHFLENTPGFLLRSDRDGWRNIYYVGLKGQSLRPITKVDWEVIGIERIDEANDRLFFRGTGEDPVDEHFYRIGLDGAGLKKLTGASGAHNPELSPNGSYFVDRFSSLQNPGETAVYDEDGRRLRRISRVESDPNAENGLTVESFTISTEDGFDLPAYWVLPEDFDENKQYPVVFSIYGGPGYGGVSNRYRNFSYNPLIEMGVIHFVVDHRGSGKFGKKGLDYLHRNLGKWEMNDYIEAVKWLRKKEFIDPERIGISGSSYGGYMSAMALTYGSGYFTHGIAGLPVTDWRLYDNVYTERYMDRPADNPDGYAFGSVMSHANELDGQLLIVHGVIDDNVHLQNTMQLVSSLQDKGKDFEMMLYPGGRHGWGGPKRLHWINLEQEFWRMHFFEDAAGDSKP